jgi:uncharacterized membrane protein YtjA (UPF0391 family)
LLHYAVAFVVIALIAAVIGFGDIAADAAGIAKLFFYVFAMLAAGALMAGRKRRSQAAAYTPNKRGPT